MLRTISTKQEGEIFRALMIKKAKRCVNASTLERLIRGAEFDSYRDELSSRMVYQLEITMASLEKKTQNRYTTITGQEHFPANPWEHLKEAYAPKWFLFWWPVKYRTVDIKSKTEIVTVETRVCPHVNIPNDERTHYEWLSAELPE